MYAAGIQLSLSFEGGLFYAAFIKIFSLYAAFPETFSRYNGGYVFGKKFF